MIDMNNLITDNIDAWTSAIKKKSATGRGTSKKIELTGVKKLRELILELAVRGKLLPQDSNDEPASVLLDKVAVEKAQLIADNKIKKTKSLPVISEEEIPFILPNGWEFERLGNCSIVFSGNSFKSGDFNSVSGVKVIKITNAGVGKLIDTNEFLPDEFLEKYQSFHVYKNDIILALTRPYISDGLKVSLCPDSYHKSLLNQRVAAIRAFQYPEYLFLNLRSPYILNLYKNRFGGNGLQPNLKMGDVTELVIALPPLAEQHRIVAKVDELMALCDQLEQQTEQSLTAHQTLVEVLLNALFLSPVEGNAEANVEEQFQENWQRIADHFDVLFTTEASIDQLKQTILQLAVMGKIVPQNPSDEPASKLLEKIAEEKAQLIKDKKIKKQKPLPAITDEEKPFGLPSGWEWVRLGNIGIGSTGKTPSTRNNEFFGGNIEFIGPGNITPQGQLLKADKFLTELGTGQSTSVVEGALLMVCIGGSIGKSALASERISFNQQINAMQTIEFLPKFLKHSVSTDIFYKSVLEKSTGSATPIINRGKWEELLIPAAPLSEQHRIVAKVDELMALCDQLKTRLADAQITQLHLADAVVENALN